MYLEKSLGVRVLVLSKKKKEQEFTKATALREPPLQECQPECEAFRDF